MGVHQDFSPSIAHLRRLGIRLVVYLDDILIVHSSDVGKEKKCVHCQRTLGVVRFFHQRKKIDRSTSPDDGIHWDSDRLLNNIVHPHGEEIDRAKESM